MTALAQTAQLCVTTPTTQTPLAMTQLYATPPMQQPQEPTQTQLALTEQTLLTQPYATTQTQQTPLATTQ